MTLDYGNPRANRDGVFGSRAAFTLVELLVVVAIISVLAALLMPAVGNALQSSRGAACASNERQIYLGLGGYLGDWNGAIPGVADVCDSVYPNYSAGYPFSYYFHYWTWFTDAGFGGTYLGSQRFLISDRVGAGKGTILDCPAIHGGMPLRPSGATKNNPSDYALDVYPAGQANNRKNRTISLYQTAMRSHPSQEAMVIDFGAGSEFMNWTFFNQDHLPGHALGNNALYYDGHVARVGEEAMYRWTAKAELFWNE